MTASTMKDLFVEQLRDIYHAEKQLVKALPKMAKAASDTNLRQAFEQHLEQTRNQVQRLEQVFDQLDIRVRGKPCEAMEGLVEEAKEIMEEIRQPEVLDVALIAAAQKVEHYEIAAYGSLATFAESLGNKQAAELLSQTLAEEKQTDEKLTQLAVSEVNQKALKQAAE